MAIEAPRDAVAITQHPLDPLSVEEVDAVARLVKGDERFPDRPRFVAISLREPSKATVHDFVPGDPIERRAEVVLLDRSAQATVEIDVSLSPAGVLDWRVMPGVQASITPDEFAECEEAVKADPAFRAALRERGITDPSLLMVDPWSFGNAALADEAHRRVAWTLAWVRSDPADNGYAHPVEGLIAVVDLNTMEVIRIEDHGSVPVPQEPGNYTTAHVDQRTDVKALEISQPDGPSFELAGHELRWQNWNLRVGFTPREGLVIHTVSYRDGDENRQILFRASVSEMVVPYGDPAPSQYRKNAFDTGEYGIGAMVNSLTLGCDCLGEIRYIDAVLCDGEGRGRLLENAVCIHEEDFGLAWKHTDWRTKHVEVRRLRRLVVSCIATVGNYEYGFYWYFYQDGSIEAEVKLTGIVSTAALAPGEMPKHGSLIAPQLYAADHQHFFNVRLDVDIDGASNVVHEVQARRLQLDSENPYGNAFVRTETLLRSESEAQRTIDPLQARHWKISNPHRLNRLGQPVAYKLMPGENVLPFADESSNLMRRAGFLANHLWVTPLEPMERYAAGDYPNQSSGGDGLPVWTSADRSIEDTDVVLWYTMGSHHIPRPEDWPVMPVTRIGFVLRPAGFFDGNPALDLPAPHPEHCMHVPAENLLRASSSSA